MKESTIKYTSSGCEIVYEEVGERTGLYRVELEKTDDHKLITRRINIEEG